MTSPLHLLLTLCGAPVLLSQARAGGPEQSPHDVFLVCRSMLA